MILRVAVGLLVGMLGVVSVTLAGPARAADSVAGSVVEPSAGWVLTAAQLKRLESGGILSDGDITADPPVADFRAAILIAASLEQVFRTLTDCADALRFVPHLKRCAVVDTAPDGRWQDVEQTVDYGWLAPRARYVFHAEYDRYASIRFSHVRGDFHENHGSWEFTPMRGGTATIVTYRARVSPAFYVPRWLMRSMLKRDLPDLMRGLRARAEATRQQSATSAPEPSP